MTTAAMQEKVVLAAPRAEDRPPSLIMMAVARKYGLSPLQQMREMVALRCGPGRISPAEYYAYGLFDPETAPADKREYVGRVVSDAINDRLSPPELTGSRAFLRDKVLYTSLLERLGLPTTHTQAVAMAGRRFGAIPALASPSALRDYLLNRAEFPLFGKPCAAASARSVLISGIEDDRIVLGNGRRVALEDFCSEVFAGCPAGFILQSALPQHPDLTGVTGASAGTLRVVTVRDGDTPRVLYTVWKIPAPRSMRDGFRQAGAMVAAVDDHGRVGRCRRGTGLDGHWIDAHPETGQPFAGLRIPHWDALHRIACEAHALFPEFGIAGWDMDMTPEGPAIVEADHNPFHALWQRANGRGIRNAGFRPVLDAATDRSRAIAGGRLVQIRRRLLAGGDSARRMVRRESD